MIIDNCKIEYLPKIQNRFGNLTFVENMNQMPFDVKRIYYIYDIPSGQERGGHAHKSLFQCLIAISGSFDVNITDGEEKLKIHLNSPDKGLLIPSGIWRDLSDFSSGAICLVLASDFYNETDYIRNYNDFLTFRNCI